MTFILLYPPDHPKLCKYCQCLTNEPLIHYFLDCENTRTFFDISDIYVSRSIPRLELAANIANYLVKLENFSQFAKTFPPPR